MSLIPSESYSFPDHFTSTRAASRKPKNVEPEPEPVEPPRKKPAIVALPNPKPQSPRRPPPVAARENPESVHKVLPPVPNPALRRAAAPPPRIPETPVRKMSLPPSLKPKVRWNNRAPAIDPTAIANNGNGNGNNGNGHGSGNGADHIFSESLMPPAHNVIQLQPALVPRAPRPTLRSENLIPQQPPEAPKPIPVVPIVKRVSTAPPPKPIPPPALRKPAPVAKPVQPVQPVRSVQPSTVPETPRPMVAVNQADFFEMFAENNDAAVSKHRRKGKMRRFLVCESIAIGILLPLALTGILLQPENVALRWIVSILTIAAAVLTAIIPILFFAFTPTLPEIER